ncbi:MAG: 3-hydroxyacyl-CoA dehydrogenase NAD-binding domain-containing protein [Pirellulales bacterium]
MTSTIRVEFPESDIALVVLDHPDKSANVLSAHVLDELSQVLDRLQQQSGLAGIIVSSGKPGMFIAGADLREFVQNLHVPAAESRAISRRGQQLFASLSETAPVTIAAIDGICVGGGAELACWCDRRLLSDNPKTEFGFPEVKLGLYPGWGGTARLPRLIGLGNAVRMITGGESIDPPEAYRLGLATDVVPAEGLIAAAIRLVRAEQASGQYLRDRQRWSGPVEMNETELGFLGATAAAMIQGETKGQYPAPLAALDVLLGAASADINTACEMEAEGMSHLFGSPVNAALLNVFFLTDRNKKDRGVERDDVAIQSIQSVAVIGAGIMGAGIASANIKRGVPVTMADANREALGRGVRQVLEEAAFDKKFRGPSPAKMLELAPILRSAQNDAAVAACDLVIEAIVENVEVKQQVYERLESQLGPNSILASNTSTIPITRLASKLKRPERFCGIHFFNPVRRMKLVEVIRGRHTSDETIATAVAYAKRIGKSPIVVNDGPGFLVNRLLLPYMNESLELIAEGAEIDAIEKAATRFGMPMGPIALYDMVGLDTCFYAGRIMWEAFPDRIAASPILPALVKAGRLGCKSGKGFFSYDNKKGRAQADPDLRRFIDPYRKPARSNFSQEELTHRLFLPMLLEATRVLEAGIVRDVRDVDLGLIFGLGFPPFKGGLLFWADTLGPQKILEALQPLEGLGARMQPTAMLLDMAQHNRRFYASGGH